MALSWAGVTKAAKLALGVLALGLAALALRASLRSSDREGLAEVAAMPAQETSSVDPLGDSSAEDAAPRTSPELDERKPLARGPAEPPLPIDSDPRDGFDLFVRVLDERGTPLIGAKVRLVGPAELCFAGAADEAGELAFLDLPAGNFELLARKTNHRTHIERVELRGAPREERRELRLEPLPVLAVHVRTRAGQSYLEALEAQVDKGQHSLLKSFVAVATADPPPALLPVELGGYERDFGLGSWLAKSGPGDLAGELRVDAPDDFHVSLVLGRQVLSSQRVELGQEAVVFELDPATAVATLAGVCGRFIGAAGAPMAGIAVHVSDSSATRIVHSKLDGRFELGGMKPALVRVQALGETLGEFQLRAGEMLDLGDLGDLEPEGSKEPTVIVNGAVIVHIEELSNAQNSTKWRVARVEPGGELQRAKAEDWKKLELGAHRVGELEPGSWAVGTSPPVGSASEGRTGSVGPNEGASSGSFGAGDPPRADTTPQCARFTPFELAAGPTPEVTLRLEASGELVLEPAGVASIGTQYRVRDETTGLVNRSGSLARDESLIVILARGAWRLELELPDGARYVQAVVVGAKPTHVAVPR